MRSGVLLFFILLGVTSLMAQAFSAPIYFEDNDGRRDTIVVGYDIFATDTIDAQFGEVNILNEDTDGLDVRFLFSNVEIKQDLVFACDHEPFDLPFTLEDIALSESKVGVKRSGCSNGGNIWTTYTFTIPLEASFPLTITWDNTAFVDNYGCGAAVSWISELSRPEIIRRNGCLDRINHDSISLTGLNTFVLETPSYKTIVKEDNTLLSVYYLYLTDFGSLGPVSVNNSFKNSDLIFFPNPVQDQLYLDTPTQDWNYQILNLQGQQMMQGQYRDYIGVAGLPSGIYFLQLEREGEMYKAVKFVKE